MTSTDIAFFCHFWTSIGVNLKNILQSHALHSLPTHKFLMAIAKGFLIKFVVRLYLGLSCPGTVQRIFDTKLISVIDLVV